MRLSSKCDFIAEVSVTFHLKVFSNIHHYSFIVCILLLVTDVFVPQDDLLSLKVGSVLHHLSIKRAIQVLRLNNYEPNCLRRRPSDEVSSL